MRGQSITGNPANARPRHWVAIALLVLFTLATRLNYVPSAVMGFDGPEYINALKLDNTYNVPPPGNIGYVLLAKVISLFGADPILAYALVGTLLSCAAAVFIYLFASLVVSRPLALATSLAVMSNPMVWYHGVIMQSYIVWLATLPAIGYFGLRFVRERTRRMLIAASVATGISTILRPDLVLFGGPLLGACLVLAYIRQPKSVDAETPISEPGTRNPTPEVLRPKFPPALFTAALICAALCSVWFFTTAHLLGGIDNYIHAVRSKNEWHEHFGVAQKGLFEGFARNVVKYLTFMLWGAGLALPLAAIGTLVYARHATTRWRAALLTLAWVAPSLYFSWIIFMGNAGLILPALPLVFLSAAVGAQALVGARRAVWMIGTLTAFNIALFVFIPLRTPTNQREALLNHMFFGYSGPGIRQVYTYQLEDFGIDRSLGNTVKQFKAADPLPHPPRLPGNPASNEPRTK